MGRPGGAGAAAAGMGAVPSPNLLLNGPFMNTTSPPPNTAPEGAMKGRAFGEYRNFIRDHYDGLPGALTAVTGFLTGHEALAGRLIRPGAFDVRGCKHILDAACGNGRYSRFLLRHADADAKLTSFDLSPGMLLRARARLRSERVTHAV